MAAALDRELLEIQDSNAKGKPIVQEDSESEME